MNATVKRDTISTKTCQTQVEKTVCDECVPRKQSKLGEVHMYKRHVQQGTHQFLQHSSEHVEGAHTQQSAKGAKTDVKLLSSRYVFFSSIQKKVSESSCYCIYITI